MKRPRISIAWLTISVAAIAFPMAVVSAVMNGRPIFGLEGVLDMGLWPTVPVLAIYLFLVLNRPGAVRPFDIGFLAFGAAAVCIFVVIARAFPTIVEVPIIYYVNKLEPSWLDCDRWETYAICLLIQGSILAVPQLLTALIGALVFWCVVPRETVNRRSTRGLWRD